MSAGKPDWLKIKVRRTKDHSAVEGILKRLSLNTVCEEAGCPNRMECFGRRTATFMILGRTCTRNCTFCSVGKSGPPEAADPREPGNVAEAAKELGLGHVVVTSVTRDDLPDGGAGCFAEVIGRLKSIGGITVEVLIPDFKGDKDALLKVVKAKPDIINHNVETVPRLYPEVRPMASFERSVELLKRVKSMDNGIFAKSGMMVGLGEMEAEVLDIMKSLREADCDFLTIGQYLAPSKNHHKVMEYIHPDKFKEYEIAALGMGFRFVASGPLVRSSYLAGRALEEAKQGLIGRFKTTEKRS